MLPRFTHTLLFTALAGICCVWPATQQLHAQQIESFKDASWQAHGRLGAGLSAYSRSGDAPNRTSPFAYVLSGSLNLSYGDFSIPLSVTYHDRKGSLNNPFQYFGISPSYRWATLHLGHRSIPLGKYLLAGQTFFGVGLEVNPGKLRFAVLRGKLRSPILLLDSLIAGEELLKPHTRIVTAGRIGIGSDAQHFDLNLTRIVDRDPDEIPDRSENGRLPPADNLGLGTDIAFRIGEQISFRGETALSLITNDRSADSLDNSLAIVNALGNVVAVNESSGAYFAHDYRLAFTPRAFRVSLDFERVDPSFRSLGTPYLTNDIQRLSARVGFGLWQQRLRLETQLGRQKNNLSGLLPNSRHRTIGSASLSAKLSSDLNLRLRYYNFSTELQDGLLIVDDTLRHGQQTATYQLAPRYRKRLDDGSINVNLSADYRAIAYTGSEDRRRNSDQYSLRLTGGRSWTANDFSLNGTLAFRRTLSTTTTRNQLQLGLRTAADLFEKSLNTGLSIDYTARRLNSEADGGVLSLGLNLSYRISKKSNLGLRLNQLLASSPVPARELQELRSHLNYSFTF